MTSTRNKATQWIRL